ncbi:hypothetical protein LTR10_009171 [Elasticomyces elasticus]|nr:hypothetical protein LTR10_009171 [Elasticomyces elasticus]
MDKSAFERLPPELRNRIHELVLRRCLPIVVKHIIEYSLLKDCQPSIRTPQAKAHLTALTQACKTFHAECSPLFYASNRFTIIVAKSLAPEMTLHVLYKFLTQIGDRNRLALRDVTFDLGRYGNTRNTSMHDLQRALFEFEHLSELESQIESLVFRVISRHKTSPSDLRIPGRSMKEGFRAEVQVNLDRLRGDRPRSGTDKWWKELDFCDSMVDVFLKMWPEEVPGALDCWTWLW